MLQGLKDQWHDLKQGQPGSRFVDHYQRRHQGSSSPWRKALFLGGGALIVAAGIFFLPAPGPGFLVIFLGGGLIAQESIRAARLLDWCELRVRRVVRWALGTWKRAPALGKTAIALLGLLLVGGAGFAAWELFLNK
jgi:uncharacterized protein (TIGR02611 family)